MPVPADSAKSVVIEAAELLECFQWDETDKKRNPKNWEEIGLEVADVFWYLVTFCHHAGLDLGECVEKKITHLEKKYPAKMFQGKHNEEFYQKRKRKYRRNRIK